MIAGLGTTAGDGITSWFALKASPCAPAVTTNITMQVGGNSGVWMSVMAPATDGERTFVSANGFSHEK